MTNSHCIRKASVTYDGHHQLLMCHKCSSKFHNYPFEWIAVYTLLNVEWLNNENKTVINWKLLENEPTSSCIHRNQTISIGNNNCTASLRWWWKVDLCQRRNVHRNTRRNIWIEWNWGWRDDVQQLMLHTVHCTLHTLHHTHGIIERYQSLLLQLRISIIFSAFLLYF